MSWQSLQGQWPLFVFMLMFIVLPLATIPGLFDVVFIVLGGFTLVIVGLTIASVISARRKTAGGK